MTKHRASADRAVIKAAAIIAALLMANAEAAAAAEPTFRSAQYCTFVPLPDGGDGGTVTVHKGNTSLCSIMIGQSQMVTDPKSGKRYPNVTCGCGEAR